MGVKDKLKCAGERCEITSESRARDKLSLSLFLTRDSDIYHLMNITCYTSVIDGHGKFPARPIIYRPGNLYLSLLEIASLVAELFSILYSPRRNSMRRTLERSGG